MSQTSEKRYLRLSEAATLIGVSYETVRSWVNRELIRSVVRGGGVGADGKPRNRRLRIPVEEAERVANERASGLPVA